MTPPRFRFHIAVALSAALLLTGCHSSATRDAERKTAIPSAAGSSALAAPSSTASSAPSPPATLPAPQTTGLPVGVLASIRLDLGSAPEAITTGFGSVWVGAHRQHYVYRINPATNKVTARIDIGQYSCSQMLATGHRLYVGNCDDAEKFVVIDPATNQVSGNLAAAFVIGTAQGSLWATNQNGSALLRLDPATLRVQSTTPLEGDIGAIGGGYLWLINSDGDTDERARSVIKVDATTGKVVGHLIRPVTGGVEKVDYLDGILWFVGLDDDFVAWVNTKTGRSGKVALPVIAPVLVDNYDVPLVNGMGSLWLRTDSQTVMRLDAESGKRTAEFPSDPAANGGWPAVGFGSLWVANFDTDTVWRVRVP